MTMQVDKAHLNGVVTAELLAEHSGCGRGVQVEQVTAKLAPGDAVYVVRGKLGQVLLVPKSSRIVSLVPLSALEAVERELRSLRSTEGKEGEDHGSDAAAIEIADAVIAWMVRNDLLDADQEYRDDDIVEVLNDLRPDEDYRQLTARAEAAEAHVAKLLDGGGYVFWNPDSGEEYSESDPTQSGECDDAEHIRKSTAQEDVLWKAMQSHFTARNTRSDPTVRDRVTDEMVERAAVEYLSHKGERPNRVTRGGWELWESCSDAMRAALTAALRASPPEPASGLSQSAIDVLTERQRQITAEGWTPEHDDAHDKGQIASAAARYALVAGGWSESFTQGMWPWAFAWWKPSTPRRNLVKAAALILAEIDRLDRLPTPPAKEPQ